MGVCFNPNSSACQSCVFAEKCQPRAYQALEAVHKEVPIPALMRMHNRYLDPEDRKVKSRTLGRKSSSSKFQLTVEQERQLSYLAKKPQRITRRIFEDGIDIKADLKRGHNPFAGQPPKFLSVPCELLLKDGFDRRDLKAAYLRETPDMSESTAASQASMAVAILETTGACEWMNGKFRRVL